MYVVYCIDPEKPISFVLYFKPFILFMLLFLANQNIKQAIHCFLFFSFSLSIFSSLPDALTPPQKKVKKINSLPMSLYSQSLPAYLSRALVSFI